MKIYLNPDMDIVNHAIIIETFIKISQKESDYIKIPTLNSKKRLEELIEKIGNEKQIIFYDFRSLCITLTEFRALVDILSNKNIEIKFLNEKDYMIETIIRIGEIETNVISERVQNGIEVAKRKGKILGRPKIDQDVAKRIKFLYKQQNKTIREVANECDVSIGSVYKYIHEDSNF